MDSVGTDYKQLITLMGNLYCRNMYGTQALVSGKSIWVYFFLSETSACGMGADYKQTDCFTGKFEFINYRKDTALKLNSNKFKQEHNSNKLIVLL